MYAIYFCGTTTNVRSVRLQEHDQRAMGAFLNYTERISLDAEDGGDRSVQGWKGWGGYHDHAGLIGKMVGGPVEMRGVPE